MKNYHLIITADDDSTDAADYGEDRSEALRAFAAAILHPYTVSAVLLEQENGKVHRLATFNKGDH